MRPVGERAGDGPSGIRWSPLAVSMIISPMPSPPARAVVALVLALTALAAAGCGDGQRRATTATVPAGPNATPPSVPRHGVGPADPDERRVIDDWLATLRRGQEVRAARFFAPGARVQNASPVFVVRSLAERTQFQRVLACGAVDRDAVSGGDHFTIVTFLLVERPGGFCGSGVGQEAKAAIRVKGGRIVGWYRLPGGSYQGDEGPQVQA